MKTNIKFTFILFTLLISPKNFSSMPPKTDPRAQARRARLQATLAARGAQQTPDERRATLIGVAAAHPNQAAFAQAKKIAADCEMEKLDRDVRAGRFAGTIEEFFAGEAANPYENEAVFSEAIDRFIQTLPEDVRNGTSPEQMDDLVGRDARNNANYPYVCAIMEQTRRDVLKAFVTVIFMTRGLAPRA